MKLKLKIAQGSQSGKELRLNRGSFVIGRGKACQLRAHSDLVSRRHCEIIVSDSEATIQDCGSKNGTLVNGERLKGQQNLKHGDILQIGPLQFEVLVKHSDARAPTPASVEPSKTLDSTAPAKPVESAAPAMPKPGTSGSEGDDDSGFRDSGGSDSSGSYEDDISQWLDDSEPEASLDTGVGSMDETSQVDVRALESNSRNASASSDSKAIESKAPTPEAVIPKKPVPDKPAPKRPDSKTTESEAPPRAKSVEPSAAEPASSDATSPPEPKKLPPTPSAGQAKDSGQAAADVLRAFNRRR